jgi:hypothetical protein
VNGLWPEEKHSGVRSPYVGHIRKSSPGVARSRPQRGCMIGCAKYSPITSPQVSSEHASAKPIDQRSRFVNGRRLQLAPELFRSRHPFQRAYRTSVAPSAEAIISGILTESEWTKDDLAATVAEAMPSRALPELATISNAQAPCTSPPTSDEVPNCRTRLRDFCSAPDSSGGRISDSCNQTPH